MVYHRKDMWEEDKWDIHSSSYNQGKDAGRESEDSVKYKHEQYGSKTEKDAYEANEDYRKKEEEGKKGEKESDEPSIEDAVKKEEKMKDSDENQEIFKTAAEQFSKEFQQDNIKKKKKGSKSIEEAISKAIKEEKETIIVD